MATAFSLSLLFRPSPHGCAMSVGVDLYGVLKVQKSASADEVKRAYRRLAMKWHPDIHEPHQQDRHSALDRFESISHAYDVLSDPLKRKLYDEVGKENLNANFREPRELFQQVFGFWSPAEINAKEAGGLQDALERVFNSASEVALKPEITCKAPAIVRTLSCSLEDLYNGCTKKVKILIDQADSCGRNFPIEQVLTIEVKPGWKAGMRITFPGVGNSLTGMLPSDVVFVIEEKHHKAYTRQGNDLVMVAKVPLVDALTGYTARVYTLDGRVLMVPCVDVLHPGSEVTVKMEGMPGDGNGKPSKGNLQLHFDIVFPAQLSSQQKTALRHALLDLK